MEILLKILFWASVAAMFYTYVGFHLILEVLAKFKKKKRKRYKHSDELPRVSILVSVYNEDAVIREKVLSTFNTEYPADKIELIIGSDNSSDETNAMLRRMAEEEPRLKFIDFPTRQGKPVVINQLVSMAEGEVLIITDAKVYFKPYTIFELAKNFKDAEVSIVGANIYSYQDRRAKEVRQEKLYMSREMRVKYLEGKLWGAVAGVFGACFAIRKEDFRPVPPRYLVDDFYITMKVLANGKAALQDKKAIAIENVTPSINEEFRRKIRISTGNFQNMRVFSRLLLKGKGVGFSIFSHKILRWIGPFFLMAVLATSCFLTGTDFYRWILYLYLLSFFLVSVDLFLMRINKHFVLLRFLTHFYYMNLALLIGLFRALKGVKSSAWEPTKREQVTKNRRGGKL